MSQNTPSLGFARHPARHGILWLSEASRMLSARRVTWMLLLLLYYAVQLAVSLVPLVGPLAAMLLRPVFAVGFLAAAWTQERGEPPRIAHLFRGFRSNLWALLPIGVVLIVGTTLAVLASALVDGGALLDAIGSGARPDEALTANPRMEAGMLFSVLCAIPVMLAVWFAPALVVFQDHSAAQAMAGSLRAALANWRPVMIYGVLLFLCGAVVPAIAIALIAFALPQAIAPFVVALVVVPYVFLFITAQTISDYVAYRDIFHAGEGAAPSTGGDATER
jgi:uncharacterized membrane protein